VAIRVASFVLLLMGGVLIVRALPFEGALARLQSVSLRLGALGPLIYGIGYVLAALAFVPGAALTLGAGALFGISRGLVVVSLASTLAAAAAFWMARHVGRRYVEKWALSHPRFRAIDRAIAEGGWRVVALLRLSPAMPFSAGNYLFGLTAIRFGPYVLTSWLAMLPGALLYVALGHAGRAAAMGASRTPAEWGLLMAGIAASALATGYIAQLARRAVPGSAALQAGAPQRRARLTWRLPVSALVALALGLWAHAQSDVLRYAFGPPLVAAVETHAGNTGSAAFDHSAFDALLREHVDQNGLVDYAALRAQQPRLDAYLTALAQVPLHALGRDETLALLLNAYNAFTLQLVVERWPVASIRDIPDSDRWDAQRWNLAGATLSLNGLEHERIRAEFREPRTHFALVCAARGCPPLRAEAYTGARLEEQLADQSRRVHTDSRWIRFDEKARELHVTALYDWYQSDFTDGGSSLSETIADQRPGLRLALDAGEPVRVVWLPYDWSLNEQ
jgi:uncharacterized membrane protein YdjX (TVP38/TMEM64 family)